MKDLITFIKKNSIGTYKEDVKLEKNTTYKVGGVASLFVYPKNTDKLIILLDKLNKEGSELSFNVGQLKLTSQKDGKKYMTDVLDS